MTAVDAATVRAFVIEDLDDALREAGYSDRDLPDDFDLHDSGLIDSLGLLEIITAVEERFGLAIDFETLDPAELTVLGAFCRFVAEQSSSAAVGRT